MCIICLIILSANPYAQPRPAHRPERYAGISPYAVGPSSYCDGGFSDSRDGGYYVVRKFRDRNDDDVPAPHEVLRNFREFHHKGDIIDVEFRTIKTMLND